VPTETSIRRANQKDYATVLKFHQELYVRFRDQIAPAEALPLFAYRDLDTTLRDDVHGLLRARDTWVLLAERAGQAVGYVSGHLEVDARRLLVKRGVVEDWLWSRRPGAMAWASLCSPASKPSSASRAAA
jgi:hypothetical protein